MRIGVFTSGGDAPGMNACIRAVVRTALPSGHEVIGIKRGFKGLLEEDFYYSVHRNDHQMHLRSVSNIVHRGGTILHTSRCERFRTKEGLEAAAAILRRHRIDNLVAIGGDGTFRGCMELACYWDGSIIGCPGTIDNDLSGTDVSIGFTSAVSTAAEAVDKIRDTADATERLFLVEVMGRNSGQIAMHTALATGADAALIPEIPFQVDDVVKQLEKEQKSRQNIVDRDRGRGRGRRRCPPNRPRDEEHAACLSTRDCSFLAISSAAGRPPFAIGSWPVEWAPTQSKLSMTVKRRR